MQILHKLRLRELTRDIGCKLRKDLLQDMSPDCDDGTVYVWRLLEEEVRVEVYAFDVDFLNM